MANRHNQHIDSTSFKEIAYRYLSKVTPEQKESFTYKERYIFSSDYILQKFCKEERIDHVMYYLAKIGIEWTIRIGNPTIADELEGQARDQYEDPQRRVELVETTAREGICIISSRDTMTLSNMVAQNCNTKVYHISEFSQKLIKKGRDFGQLKTWDNEKEKANNAHDLFNNMILELLNSFAYAEEILHINANELRILSALYKKRNSAIRMTDISSLTKAKGRKMYFRKDMKKLLQEGLVSSDQKDTKKIWANSSYFMISTRGINSIMRYKEYVFNNVFGD